MERRRALADTVLAKPIGVPPPITSRQSAFFSFARSTMRASRCRASPLSAVDGYRRCAPTPAPGCARRWRGPMWCTGSARASADGTPVRRARPAPCRGQILRALPGLIDKVFDHVRLPRSAVGGWIDRNGVSLVGSTVRFCRGRAWRRRSIR